MIDHLHAYCILHMLPSWFVFLPVVGPHFIINPTANQEVVINETLTLTCSAEGFPIPSIVWFMNNTMISNKITNVESTMNTSSTLIISNANFNDSGMYYCQAVSSEFPDVNVTSTIAIITVVGELVNENKLLLLFNFLLSYITMHAKIFLFFILYLFMNS